MRIGSGYDVHRLVEGRRLILGGVDIMHPLGLLGHSDADVLLHAIMDALLGAASLGDIGKLFPDTDVSFQNISSILLLKQVASKIAEAGFEVGNIDCTIVAQWPKLSPYTAQMEENIAAALGVGEYKINIKATTTEQMGFAGRGEGIAAYAVALINEKGRSL